jgi:hypothetical protein
LTKGYGASAQGYQDQLAALNPQYAQLAAENASTINRLTGENAGETRALQGRYDSLGATNTAENNALRGRYDALGAESAARNKATIDEYNGKINPLQKGVIPQAFLDNQQRILNRSANDAVGSLLTGLGSNGAINSSLGRKGIGDISYNTEKVMDESYLSNIDRLSALANQQYGNQNINNSNMYSQGMGVLDANGNLIQRNFSNGMGVLDANGNLIQQRFSNGLSGANSIFGNGMTGLNAQGTNIQNGFSMNQNKYNTQMQNISAPMQYAAAAQEAQDAPLTRLISNANASNQYPFNFWNANNSSWANMNTPAQTVVTQQEGIGGALGGLAGLAAKFIK